MIHPNKHFKNIALPPRAHSIQALDTQRSKNGIFKLDSNEAVVPPSPKVIAAIKKFLDSKNNLNWYPNPTADKLRKEIAQYIGARPEQILPTNGSEQALEFLSNTYVEKGDEIVVPTPTFSPFLAWPLSRGGKIVKVHDLSASLDGVTKAFPLPAFWRVISVSSSSAPFTYRPTTDYTVDGSAHTITFTSEIQAASSLQSGQTLIVMFAE